MQVLNMVALVPLGVDDGTGITGWIDQLLADVGKLAVRGGGVLATLVFVITAVAARAAIAKMISAGFAAMLIVWMVNGGIGWGGDEVKEETNNKRGAPAVVQVIPGDANAVHIDIGKAGS